MSTSTVRIVTGTGSIPIRTTVTQNESEINRLVKAFLSNKKNDKRIIGMDIELSRKEGKENRIALFQLCDGENCLIVQFQREGDNVKLPLALFNMLNLPGFTFAGIGINKTLVKLESECGLTCKNVAEVGSSTWNLDSRTPHQSYKIKDIVKYQKPINAVLNNWDNSVLNRD